MDFKSILLLLASIAWILLCQRWYCCWMQDACLECSNEPRNSLAIGFLAGSATPDTTALFSNLVDQIQKEKKKNHFLEISGRYSSSEGQTLGLTRAQHTATLLNSFFGSDSISLRSQQSLSNKNIEGTYLPLVDIQWVPITTLPKPEKLIIHFPNRIAIPNLTEKEQSEISNIINYAKKYNSTIKISGHSDATGLPAFNEEFSWTRAEKMGEIFKQRGIPSSKLILEKFGQRVPVDLKNPANNRRVEITIIN